MLVVVFSTPLMNPVVESSKRLLRCNRNPRQMSRVEIITTTAIEIFIVSGSTASNTNNPTGIPKAAETISTDHSRQAICLRAVTAM